MKKVGKVYGSLLVIGLGLLTTSISHAQDNAPVETRDPETEYQAAIEGQTRAPSMTTETAYTVDVITQTLESPWGLTELPDARLLITQKQGNLVIVDVESGEVSDPIEGFENVNSDGQGGLLDVALAPDFEESSMIYFTLSEEVEGGTLTAVGRGQLSEDESMLENFEVIYRAEPAYLGDLHYGSRLVFDADGNLYVTTGERSDSQMRDYAQSLDSGLGKVLHITADGEPVADNAVFTLGHRNVQGLAIDPATGDVWISEMGPRGGDELNLLQEGKNYGWPVVSYGIEYSGAPIGEGITSDPAYTEPVYYWDPVIAPSGMDFYNSDVVEEWQGNLFIGGLGGEQIARLLIEDQTVVAEERLLEDEGERFRDILVGSDGAIYAITDSGKLYQIRGE